MLKTADFRDFCRVLGRIAFALVFGILSFVCLGYGEAVRPDEPSHTVIYSCGYVVPLSEFSVETLSGGSGGKDGGQSGGSSIPVSVSGTPPVDETCNDSSRCFLFSIDSVDNNPCASAGYTFDHWECNHWGVAINWEGDGYGGGSWNSYFDMSDHMAGSGYTFEQIEESCNDTVYCEAKWVKTNYTVSFSTGTHGNGTMSTLTKNYTDTVTLPSNGFTADAGYRFVNWKDLKSSVYKNAGQTFSMPAKNVTWVAQWAQVNYTVSFDANGGTGTMGNQTGKHYGDIITLPQSSFGVPTGYQFNGWNCGASVNNGNDLNAGNTFAMPAGNVTCTAQWKYVDYTVYFDKGEGSGTMSSQTGKHYGDTITLPPNSFTAPNGNYLFVGWNCGASVNSGNNLQAGNTFSMPAESVTCTAQWSACSCYKGTGVYACSVTGVSNNKCQYSYVCDSNYHVSRRNNDVQSGTFAGNAGVTNNSISCEEDELTYNVEYNCNNNDAGIDPSDGNSPYTVDTKVTVLSDESTCKIPVGKSFSGWFCYKTGDKNTKVDDRPFRMPAYDVTCDAHWCEPGQTVNLDGTCNAGCGLGYYSSYMGRVFDGVVDVSKDGKGYFGDELNRQNKFFSDSNDDTLVNLYGLLSPHAGGEYGVMFYGESGPVAAFGTSMCTETPGSNNWQTNPQSYINDWLKPTASLSQNAGEYCWCTFDGYSLDGKNVIEIKTDLWVYADKFLSGVDCQEKCASKCAESLQTDSDFRGAMFKNLEGCFPETYDITYYGCDGRTAVLVEDALTYNENYTILDIGDTGLDSTGYVFNGWSTASSVQYSVGASNSPWTQTNGLTLYADCDRIKEYSVTYNCNNSGQGTTPTDNNLYQQNTSVTTQQNTCWAPLGKEFSRWNCGGTYVNAGNSFTITSNTTCTAEWTDVNPCEQGDTPTFYSAVPEEYISQNGTIDYIEVIFDYGSYGLSGSCSSRTGVFPEAFYDDYNATFMNYGQTGANCWCAPLGSGLENGNSWGERFRVVFLQSFADQNQCEANCDSGCLTALANNANFRRSVYSFVQCHPQSVIYDCGVGASGSATDPDNPYSVGATVNILSGASGCVAPVGYSSFEQWNCSLAVGSNPVYEPRAPIYGYTVGDTSFIMPAESEVVCSAQWAQANYTVSFVGGDSTNNGEGTLAIGNMTGQTGVHYGDTITLPDNGNNPPANGFSLDGYTFSGWKCGSSVNNNATLAANDTFTMPAANVTCTAQWEAVPTYSVTYTCGNNPTTNNPPTDSNSPYVAGTTDIVLVSNTDSNCAKTGSTFTGWSCDNGVSATQPGDTFTMPAANVTCTAQWNPNTIYLAWLLNGGTITGTNAPMCTYGTSAGQSGSITPIHDPTRNGYRFTGWNISTIENSGYTRLAYLDSNGNQYIDTGFTPNGDYKHTIVFDVLDTDEGYLCGTSVSSGISGNTKIQNKRLVAVNNHSASDVSVITSVLQTPTNLVSGRNTLVMNLRNNTASEITLNGSNNLAYNTSSSITSSESIKLFRAGVSSLETNKMRIYYDLIEQNGVPVKILVPVKIDSTGEIGMYDLVNQVFLPNSGTGTFTGPAQ